MSKNSLLEGSYVDVREAERLIARAAWNKAAGPKGMGGAEYYEIRDNDPDRWNELNDRSAANRISMTAYEVLKLRPEQRKDYLNEHYRDHNGSDELSKLKDEIKRQEEETKKEHVKLAREISKLPQVKRKEYYKSVASKSGFEQAHRLAVEVTRQLAKQQGMER